MFRVRAMRAVLLGSRSRQTHSRSGCLSDNLSTMQKPPVVGIINSTPDIVDMLRVTFETAGFAVVSTFTHAIRDGEVDIEAMMRQHDPRVIVYDIAPPYASNWQLFQHIASMPAMQGRTFILTSINKDRVQELARDCGLPILEVAETPHDLDALLTEVARAVGEGLGRPRT